MYKIVSGASLFDLIISDSKISDLMVTYIKDDVEYVTRINIIDSLNGIARLLPELGGYRLTVYEDLKWINESFLPLLSNEQLFEDAVYVALVYSVDGVDAAQSVCSPELRRLIIDFCKIPLEVYDKAIEDAIASLLRE